MSKALITAFSVEDFEEFLGEKVNTDEYFTYEFTTPKKYELIASYRKNEPPFVQVVHIMKPDTNVQSLSDSIRNFINKKPMWAQTYNIAPMSKKF
jgi:hypothetical protein